MRNKIVLLLCCCFLLFALLGGCQNSTAKKPMTPQQKPQQTDNQEMTDSERRVLASKLSSMAEKVENVQKATVVVANIGMSSNDPAAQKMPDEPFVNNNNNAQGLIVMAGLTLNTAAMNDTAKVDDIKKTVGNKLKESDKRISQVLVTADPNLVKRIQDVAAGIIEGKPMQSFEKDINDLNTKLKQEQPAF